MCQMVNHSSSTAALQDSQMMKMMLWQVDKESELAVKWIEAKEDSEIRKAKETLKYKLKLIVLKL